LWTTIDRLPSGSIRAWLMMDGQRYITTFSTETDGRLWEVETHDAAGPRR
jgi:hypothetical protein